LSEEFHGSNGPKTMIGTHVAAANCKKNCCAIYLLFGFTRIGGVSALGEE
jgi:hypothetical protein